VTHINASILERQINEELVPVVATVGVDEAGQAYNVNADAVAGAIAAALKAEKLVYLTNVAGLYRDIDDPASLISQIAIDDLEDMVSSGSLNDGMVPKVASCVAALRQGVGRAHLLDGRTPHALLLEVFTKEGIGTMVTVS
ncbi:MAG: acetylglutamate kinase, partial [Acidimicrobiia bacterium]